MQAICCQGFWQACFTIAVSAIHGTCKFQSPSFWQQSTSPWDAALGNIHDVHCCCANDDTYMPISGSVRPNPWQFLHGWEAQKLLGHSHFDKQAAAAAQLIFPVRLCLIPVAWCPRGCLPACTLPLTWQQKGASKPAHLLKPSHSQGLEYWLRQQPQSWPPATYILGLNTRSKMAS